MTIWLPSWHGSSCSSIKDGSVVVVVVVVDLKIIRLLLVQKFAEIQKIPQWLKITEKVSFNIASEASYVYILSGQKFIKNAKKIVNFADFLKT